LIDIVFNDYFPGCLVVHNKTSRKTVARHNGGPDLRLNQDFLLYCLDARPMLALK